MISTVILIQSQIQYLICFTVTNPIDVIKIRLQLENELSATSRGMQMFKTRYYRGFLKGMIQIAKDEGFRGLCKG